MPMTRLRQALSILLLALWFGAAGAQQMEIIELRSRTVDEVLPVLLPLVEPGGTLTGMNNQLFLRASPGNRVEIKRALAAIDAPQRRLIIRVATDRQSEDSARGAQGSGEVVLGRRSAAEIRASVWDTRSAGNESAGQMVQTVDGGQAFIRVGRSLAVPLRQIIVGPGGAVVSDSVVFRDLGSGFYATPRVNGQRVTLEISQQAERRDFRQPGGIDSQRLSTTVDGRLGEWIELGGTGRQASGQQRGFSVGTAAARDNRSIWLRVEEVE
jgi:type II secretory pathway component GspD/PulD (secretin)